MPVRYIFPANQVVAKKANTRDTMLRISCNSVTPSGIPCAILAIITMGEVKGKMLPKTANPLFGSLTAFVKMAIEKMIGIMIGNNKLCASCGSSLTALPTAAKSEEYKK